MEKKKCKGNHRGHLCVLASALPSPAEAGYAKAGGQLDKIRMLARNPAFICFNCGRLAKSRKNLCNPMPLEENNNE